MLCSSAVETLTSSLLFPVLQILLHLFHFLCSSIGFAQRPFLRFFRYPSENIFVFPLMNFLKSLLDPTYCDGLVDVILSISTSFVSSVFPSLPKSPSVVPIYPSNHIYVFRYLNLISGSKYRSIYGKVDDPSRRQARRKV